MRIGQKKKKKNEEERERKKERKKEGKMQREKDAGTVCRSGRKKQVGGTIGVLRRCTKVLYFLYLKVLRLR